VAPRRNEAIDCLRGIVMILMALDHARDFLGGPVDLRTAAPPLFFTRWITHFCAPVFVLLAGMAANLHGRRLGTTSELARFLVTRGLWLVVLEVTVVRFAWTFIVGPHVVVFQVIWAIGVAMIALGALVWLPRTAIAVVAVALVAGHNVLDVLTAETFGGQRWLWLLLHEPGVLAPFEGARWFVAYPLLPWIGVMAGGYVLGAWVTLPGDERRRRFLALGVGLTVLFVVLRTIDVYGDPQPRSVDGDPVRLLLSFLDCTKYPPSLLYLAMTLGPALCLLAALDRPLGAWARPVVVYGRVPLFYYVLHILLLHALAVVLAWPSDGAGALSRQYMMNAPLGLPLPAVYVGWIAAVAALYPACRWFADVKRRSTAAWVSYL
jgi:uncharacterized membrane protein